MKNLLIVGSIMILVLIAVQIGHKGQEVLKDTDCRSEVQYMNIYTDGTPEYKTHSDRFFYLGCDPVIYK